MNQSQQINSKRTRVWRPVRKYVGGTTVLTSVDRYEWTRRAGLRVAFKHSPDELFKSDYKLPEFLRAVKQHREDAVEVL